MDPKKQYDITPSNVTSGLPVARQEDFPVAKVLGGGGSNNMMTSAGNAEQSRAIAEAQAALAVAKYSPREEFSAYNNIMTACKRQSFAETSQYAYRRGGSMVEGPSIRMAEMLAQYWGNMTYGFRVLTSTPEQSEIEAYAWDLETNTKVSRVFPVRHYRDTRDGPKKLDAMRDQYENVASMAQRRVRSCILELIPGDFVESAVAQCNKTMSAGPDGKPLTDRVRDMVVAFKELGVTQAMIEEHLQHDLNAIHVSELTRLQKMFVSIRDGVAKRDELFPNTIKQKPVAQEESAKEPAASAEPAKPEENPKAKRTRKPKATEPVSATTEPVESKEASPSDGLYQELSEGIVSATNKESLADADMKRYLAFQDGSIDGEQNASLESATADKRKRFEQDGNVTEPDMLS